MITSLSEMLGETGHVEDITLRELLLQLVELVGADRVQIVPIQLLLQMLTLRVVLKVRERALVEVAD